MRRLAMIAAAALVLALAGCEDEDGKNRPIAAIWIRQIIFSAKPAQIAEESTAPDGVARVLDWQGEAIAGESGFVEFMPGVEVLPVRGETTVRLSFERPSADYAGWQLAVYLPSGALIAWGDATMTEQSVAIAAGNYLVAVYCTAPGVPCAFKLKLAD